MSLTWMTGAGSFWILALAFFGSSIFFASLSHYLGRKVNSPGDGCILGFANTVFVIIGGALGYRLFPFPACIVTTMIGALIAPAIITYFWIKRTIGVKAP